jgi:hypothetical protein
VLMSRVPDTETRGHDESKHVDTHDTIGRSILRT